LIYLDDWAVQQEGLRSAVQSADVQPVLAVWTVVELVAGGGREGPSRG
jgi:hypothetical protein